MPLSLAAVDLGAESGRVAHVEFDGSSLSLNIVRRFLHSPEEVAGRLRWNIPFLWSEIQQGLRSLGETTEVTSVGVDTFGVDYGLFTSTGELIENPVTYREEPRRRAFDDVLKTISPETLYRQTGTQVAPINTIFALAADQALRPELFTETSHFLMLADIFHHMLSHTTATEYTMVSTSGLFDMVEKEWAWDLIDSLAIPRHIFPNVVQPGTRLGKIRGELATGGLRDAEVIIPAAHDTASAVVTIDQRGPASMFISSGTWSLVGVVTPTPVVTDATFALNLTNEAGYPDNIRLIRNLMGLWMVQECRRYWAEQGQVMDYSELAEWAAKEKPLVSMVDPADNAFLAPGNMPQRIQDYCRQAGYAVPESPAQIIRTIIDSLAMSYRITAEDLQSVTGQSIDCVRVVGGGINNTLLQQATADATGLPVITGATEATVLGNAIVQLIALGELGSTAEGWDVIQDSIEERTYQPKNHQLYSDKAEEFLQLTKRASSE